MKKIEITIEQLESLLNQQKIEASKYITRNLSVYSFWGHSDKFDNEAVRKELMNEVVKSPYPEEFRTLKKYLS